MDKPIIKRKTNRVPGFNYSQNGTYFVTICSNSHKYLYWKCDPTIVGDGVYDVPEIILSPIGKIIEKYIELMNNKYPYISVDKYVIMPNHIHLLISIEHEHGLSQAPTPTNNVIPKFISLLKRYCNREAGINIWQRSYYEHIIRNEKDYLIHWEYIENNPIKWETDDYFIK